MAAITGPANVGTVQRLQASLAFTRMIAAGALKGYEEFIVITAFTAEPHSIHVRRPIASLDDLKGLKMRANNPTEAATFEKLGMSAIVMPANQIPVAFPLRQDQD